MTLARKYRSQRSRLKVGIASSEAASSEAASSCSHALAAPTQSEAKSHGHRVSYVVFVGPSCHANTDRAVKVCARLAVVVISLFQIKRY